MKRKEVLKDYEVNEHGMITSPGKFEGEMLYVPHFWEIYLEGFADRDNGEVLGFDVTAEDKQEFPELKKRRTVKLFCDSQGFVRQI